MFVANGFAVDYPNLKQLVVRLLTRILVPVLVAFGYLVDEPSVVIVASVDLLHQCAHLTAQDVLLILQAEV